MINPNIPQPPHTFENNIEEKSPFILIMKIVNTLTHIFIGAVVFSAIFFVNIFGIPGSLKQHVYLCVFGYMILMSQAILTLNPYASWAKTLNYEDKKVIHWVMQFTGSALAIAGSIIRMVDVQSNFKTAHGILGIVAMLCTICSLISKIVNLFSMASRCNINLIKIAHSVLGSLALCTAYLCLCLGFNNMYRMILGDQNANLSIALGVLALMGTLASSSISTFKRILN
ncbi:uncharacterized protein [Battus philenor]|uniref:uncharacterized protein n=1 Tax=Battus philenor TaxID=42288 RepID=UPI0035CF6589